MLLPAIVWDAIPNYPSNIANANWSWGDGTNTSGLYPSHTYSAAGLYNVCLSITVTCGATFSTCTLSNIFKNSQQSINASVGATLNVKNQTPTALNNFSTTKSEVSVFPNPNNGNFEINAVANSIIKIYNALGVEIYSSINVNSTQKINLSNQLAGSYFIKVISEKFTINKKIIITN